MSLSKMGKTTLSLSAIQASVSDLLAVYAQTQTNKAEELHPLYARLWGVIGEQLRAGGKRLRPYLVVLSYEAFGGIQDTAILDIAGAWELLHISMLMHDDIIDRDYIRHGQDNVAGSYLKKYDHMSDETLRLHYAHGAALLAGDLVLSSAYNLIRRSAFSLAQRQAATDILQEAIFTVIGGELLDTEAAMGEADIDEKLIAETKTASYSLIGPLLSGALLAGADQAIQHKLRRLGTVLGVGYQLVDDYLGIFGDQGVIGKPLNSDLAEGRRSRVITMSFALMNEADRRQAETWLQAANSNYVTSLRRLIEKTDIQRVVDEHLAAYKERATTIIKQLPLTPDYERLFHAVVKTLLERNA
jgi:geranylgeranyl diphosphate synthase type I